MRILVGSPILAVPCRSLEGSRGLGPEKGRHVFESSTRQRALGVGDCRLYHIVVATPQTE